MSDEDDSDLDDESEGDGASKKKTKGKRLMLIVALLVLLLLGAGAGAYVSGLLDPLLEVQIKKDPEEVFEVAPAYFLPLEGITVSLRSSSSKPRFLKLEITLELANEGDQQIVTDVMPRVVDNFQAFLRELRVEELEGSQGIYRIREELLRRTNDAVAPVTVQDILFTDILIQ